MKSITAKLMTGVICGLFSMLIGAIVSVLIMRELSKDFDNVNHQELDAREHVNLVLANFKTQVQEWKNILIQGHDAEQYDKYLKRFTDRENDIQQYLQQLQTRRYLPSSLISQIATLEQKHQKLGRRYRDGLITFRTSGFDTQKGDFAVKGIDRPVVSALNTLSA